MIFNCFKILVIRNHIHIQSWKRWLMNMIHLTHILKSCKGIMLYWLLIWLMIYHWRLLWKLWLLTNQTWSVYKTRLLHHSRLLHWHLIVLGWVLWLIVLIIAAEELVLHLVCITSSWWLLIKLPVKWLLSWGRLIWILLISRWIIKLLRI